MEDIVDVVVEQEKNDLKQYKEVSMGCEHAPVIIGTDINKIICRICGVEIFYNKYFIDVSDEYLSYEVKFNPIKFMAENKGTIAENMRLLDQDDSIAYAMHIIRCQKKVVKKLKSNKVPNPILKKLQEKVANQREELSKFNNHHAALYDHRKCIAMSKRFMKIKHTSSKVSKVTINPCNGRVELKIAPHFTNEQIGMATKILMMVSDYKFFDPYTYRGNISMHEGTMYVKMRTDSRIEEDVNFSIALY